jgi:hypothetical protein
VHLEVVVASPDGRDVVRASGEGKPVEVGVRVAGLALESGAGRILAAIRG